MNKFSTDSAFNIEFEGIDENKGIIKGVKMVSEGEAKGHGVLLNKKFIKDAVSLGKGQDRGVKARFGHPNMCTTALGTYLGTYQKVRLRSEKTEDGTRYHAVGDLHLSESSKETPNGDLYSYVLKLANESPDQFGSSIVFEGNEYQEEGDDGNMISYATIQSLHATDLVDTPAATDGLFSMNENDLASQMTMFLDENPRIFELVSKKPEIIDEFLNKYKLYTEKNENKNEMGLFKNKKPLKKIAFGEIEAVYEGELKQGTEFSAIGTEIPDNAYEVEDKIYNVKDSVLESIEEKQPEMFSEAQVSEKVDAAVTPLKTELQEKVTRIEELETELSEKSEAHSELEAEVIELKKLSSNHVPDKNDGPDNKKKQVPEQRKYANTVKEQTNKYKEKINQKRQE